MSNPVLNYSDAIQRGASNPWNLEPSFQMKSGGAISAHRLVLVASDGDAEQATAGAQTVIGVNVREVPVADGEIFEVGYGKCVLVADGAISPGDAIKAGDSGRALRFVDSTYAGATIGTGTAGNFGNQPANDGVEIVSASAGDTTQSVTIYGTTTGTDTVVVETVALNGTTPVSTIKTDWGAVLGVELSASCAGTITVREASADQTITTILTTVLQAGVTTVSAQAYNLVPQAVAAGASTKVVGIVGTSSDGTTVIYDSKALNGTTAVSFATAFKTVTKLLLGDVATGTVATVKVSATVDNPAVNLGKALQAASAQNSLFGALLFPA